jgi:hypothetical protein
MAMGCSGGYEPGAMSHHRALSQAMSQRRGYEPTVGLGANSGAMSQAMSHHTAMSQAMSQRGGL